MRCQILLVLLLFCHTLFSQPLPKHDLHFNDLSNQWDEAIPLGNATLGALIWQKNGELRLSLDRSDLWDLRPMKGLEGPEFSYQWIIEQVKKKDYAIVQQKLDHPYEQEPAPSKIPGAALQIDTKSWGNVESVQLNVAKAVATIRWKNGVVIETFIHATEPVGWFRIRNLQGQFVPRIIPPAYESQVRSGAGSVEGDDLHRLGYKQGQVNSENNLIHYTQPGWSGFYYQVAVSFDKEKNNTIEGRWSISSHFAEKSTTKATEIVIAAAKRSFDTDLFSHLQWWTKFWSKSSLKVPDTLLEKQWYLEQYKFGSTARKDAPPISLQAVWTADNGRLPPWKGDFHHDLNTQLSYWPAYSGNHLEEAMGYYNHLDENKKNYLKYTKKFFDKKGLNVPGVTTLEGKEMGGWIQYSGSPTIAAWLAHHYYLHWRYSMDESFLENRAYPWITESAGFIENITFKNEKGYRQLPLSSSPEIFNNSMEAWFTDNTNYDLALMKFVVKAASEVCIAMGKNDEAEHWQVLLKEFPDYHLANGYELMFAATKPYDESHRHFSHIMAIHPLSLINWEDGDSARKIIDHSIKALDRVGPGLWTGYSYSWLANIKARAKDGEGAAKALEIFAKAFCLKNSFHVNGDQTKSGYSTFVYRPFTLEGNFAYASGLQDMLLQSYAGYIHVFPAVPEKWKDVSFKTLRAEGAFLVSASKRDGIVTNILIKSEKRGTARLKLPANKLSPGRKKGVKKIEFENGFVTVKFEAGGEAELISLVPNPDLRHLRVGFRRQDLFFFAGPLSPAYFQSGN